MSLVLRPSSMAFLLAFIASTAVNPVLAAWAVHSEVQAAATNEFQEHISAGSSLAEALGAVSQAFDIHEDVLREMVGGEDPLPPADGIVKGAIERPASPKFQFSKDSKTQRLMRKAGNSAAESSSGALQIQKHTLQLDAAAESIEIQGSKTQRLMRTAANSAVESGSDALQGEKHTLKLDAAAESQVILGKVPEFDFENTSAYCYNPTHGCSNMGRYPPDSLDALESCAQRCSVIKNSGGTKFCRYFNLFQQEGKQSICRGCTPSRCPRRLRKAIEGWSVYRMRHDLGDQAEDSVQPRSVCPANMCSWDNNVKNVPILNFEDFTCKGTDCASETKCCRTREVFVDGICEDQRSKLERLEGMPLPLDEKQCLEAAVAAKAKYYYHSPGNGKKRGPGRMTCWLSSHTDESATACKNRGPIPASSIEALQLKLYKVARPKDEVKLRRRAAKWAENNSHGKTLS